MMIAQIDISNFKCFSALRLDLGALTLLTGFNAGGKSSAVQPLLLLAQAFRSRSAEGRLPLNGDLVRLGTTGDVFPAGTSSEPMSFAVGVDGTEFVWGLIGAAGERHLNINSVVTDIRSEAYRSLKTIFETISFISAIRSGPQEFYPVPELDNALRDVGTDGRFAAFWLERLADEVVDESRRHPDESAPTVRKQLDAWMSTLFPNAQANVQHIAQASGEILQFRVSETGEWRRPANVGYGFTYAFPIVVALLVASPGQLVIVDSPEAHLHPSAQSAMGRLLAHFAAAGVQLVVESHSDHLLNGARLAVMRGTLPAHELKIHFFTGASNAGHGVVSPLVDTTGRLSTWPDGFFDQGEKDLAQLSGWA